MRLLFSTLLACLFFCTSQIHAQIKDCNGTSFEVLSSSGSEIKIKASMELHDGNNATVSPTSTIFFEMVDMKFKSGKYLGGPDRRAENIWVYTKTGSSPELKLKIGTCKGQSLHLTPSADCGDFAIETLSVSSTEIKLKASFKLHNGINATVSPTSKIFFEWKDMDFKSGKYLGGKDRRAEDTWIYTPKGANPELKLKIGTCKSAGTTLKF